LRICLPLINLDTTTSTVVPHDREAYVEKPSLGDLVASSFLLVSDAAAIAMAALKRRIVKHVSYAGSQAH